MSELRSNEFATHQELARKRQQLQDKYKQLYEEESNLERREEFENELFMRLATGIYVKEHRQRYQKEQFDRYFASKQMLGGWDKMKMGDFANWYADLVDQLVDRSHGNKCAKIEANYDSYDEARIKPLNATIFYYFFGANRAGRSWA